MQDSFFSNFSHKCSLSHIFCISNETCQFRTRSESTCKNVYADSRVAGFKSRYKIKSDRYGYSVTEVINSTTFRQCHAHNRIRCLIYIRILNPDQGFLDKIIFHVCHQMMKCNVAHIILRVLL